MVVLEEIYVDDLGQLDVYFVFLEMVQGNVENEVWDLINFWVVEFQFENVNYECVVQFYIDYFWKFLCGLYIFLVIYCWVEFYVVLWQYFNVLEDYVVVVDKGLSLYFVKVLEKVVLIVYNYDKDFLLAFDFYIELEEVA